MIDVRKNSRRLGSAEGHEAVERTCSSVEHLLLGGRWRCLSIANTAGQRNGLARQRASVDCTLFIRSPSSQCHFPKLKSERAGLADESKRARVASQRSDEQRRLSSSLVVLSACLLGRPLACMHKFTWMDG